MEKKVKETRSLILDQYKDRIEELYTKGASIPSIARIVRSESTLIFTDRTMHKYVRDRLKLPKMEYQDQSSKNN